MNFSTVTTISATSNALSFQHPVSVPTAYFYRVRAFFPCANGFGPNSVSVRIVLSPVTAPANPNVGAQLICAPMWMAMPAGGVAANWAG